MFCESQLAHFMISLESSTRTSNSSPQSEHSYSYKGILTSTLVFNVTNIKNICSESINYGREELYTHLPKTCLILTLESIRRCYNEVGQYNFSVRGMKRENRMSLLETENWESGKVHRADSGDMVRSKQERFIANLLASEGVSFEYERQLSSWDGSFRYPDFTLFINGEQYYWEHWGMVDDYSYRQYIAKKVKWYREHGYYSHLIQTWGGGDRNLRGQVLAELYKLRKRKRIGYRPVSDSHVDRKTGHDRLTEKLEETVRQKMLQSKTADKLRGGTIVQFPRDQQPKTVYRSEEEGSAGFISQDSGQNIRGWVIPLAVILTLFLFGVFLSSRQVPAPVTTSEVPKAVSQKQEPEKELQAVKRPHPIAQEIQTEEPTTEKKETAEVFYMGIKISQ